VTFVHHPVPWSAVVRAAQREGCAKVCVWGEPGNAWADEEGVVVKQDNMPCLAVYGGLGGKDGVKGVDWVFDERWEVVSVIVLPGFAGSS
jgi:hypothetical protein